MCKARPRKCLARPSTATACPLWLRVHYKAERVVGVSPKFLLVCFWPDAGLQATLQEVVRQLMTPREFLENAVGIMHKGYDEFLLTPSGWS